VRFLRLILLAVSLTLPVLAVAQELVPTEKAQGVVIRALDMATGRSEDITIANGETKSFERLEISLEECRFPSENPSGDAFAHLMIRDIREEKPRFQGWMIASSPALSALEHPRYDVWVLRCKTPSGDTSESN